jgi:D-alanine-D-alanine ligase
MSGPRGAAPDPASPSGKRVAILSGGSSLERNVSLRSGAYAQDALRRLGHETIAIDPGPELVSELREHAPDAAFVALHGGEGEDGTIQELLEAIELPYTGSGPGACMRCADKALAKYLMQEAGIPTPAFRTFRESAVKGLGAGAALATVEQALSFPVVVKPAGGGSALGIKFANSSEQLPAAMVGAFSYDRKILIERYVKGRDLAVSVLARPSSATEGPRDGDTTTGPAIDGETSDGEPLALPVVEAIPREEEFYNYESRYQIGMTTFVCPAELDAQTTARAQELAVQVYRLLGCHGVARVDLMLDESSGELSVLETNTVPGLTETSLLPLAADAAGIGFEDLVAQILASAFSR